MNNVCIRFWVMMVAYAPAIINAQGMPGGLEKPLTIARSLDTFMYAIGGIFATIAVIIAGVGIMFYQKKWTDIAPVVIGCILIGSASALVGWLIPAR